MAAQVQHSIKLHNVQALAKKSYMARSFGLKSLQLITQNSMIAVGRKQFDIPNYCCTMLVFCRAVPEGHNILLQTQNYQHLFLTWGPCTKIRGTIVPTQPYAIQGYIADIDLIGIVIILAL